jgi:hypothetical protein
MIHLSRDFDDKLFTQSSEPELLQENKQFIGGVGQENRKHAAQPRLIKTSVIYVYIIIPPM